MDNLCELCDYVVFKRIYVMNSFKKLKFIKHHNRHIGIIENSVANVTK